MFHPPVYRATDTSLNPAQKLTCICGKDVILGNCLVCWTTTARDPEPGYYAMCSGECIVKHVTAGHA